MRFAKPRTAALLAALSLIAVAPAASGGAAPVDPPHTFAAKSCSAGFVHASLSWGEKCLRAGEYCKKGAKANREYHRYGFHCPRSGHLRHH
jgi:hypothetical protein